MFLKCVARQERRVVVLILIERRVQTVASRLPLVSRTRQFASDVISMLTDMSTRFCMESRA